MAQVSLKFKISLSLSPRFWDSWYHLQAWLQVEFSSTLRLEMSSYRDIKLIAIIKTHKTSASPSVQETDEAKFFLKPQKFASFLEKSVPNHYSGQGFHSRCCKNENLAMPLSQLHLKHICRSLLYNPCLIGVLHPSLQYPS